MASIINATTSTGLVSTADNSGSLQLATNNGTTAVTIDTSQNVGIGTVPNAWSSSSNALQNSGGALWQFGSSNFYVGQNYYFNGTNRIYTTTAEATEYQQGAGIHRWYTAPSGTAGTTATFTERMRIASDGTISTTIGSTLYGAYSARAWVNFNGTGTPAIRTSRNVSSITDNGTGDYTINFTTAMPDNEYATQVTGSTTTGAPGGSDGYAGYLNSGTTPSTSAVRVGFHHPGQGDRDALYANVSIFR